MKSEPIDSSSLIRRMLSASSSATLNCRILRLARARRVSGMLFDTTSSSSSEPSTLSTAAPDRTAWVQ